MKTDRSRVLLALGSLYVIWGSTFLGIRIALEGYPPLMLAGLRFAIAGGATYAWVRALGARLDLEPPAAAAHGIDVERRADARRRVRAARVRRPPRRTDHRRAFAARDRGARIPDRRRLDHRVQRVPVPALPRAAHARG